MSNECAICKKFGKTVEATHREVIFKRTKNYPLWLCYAHSIEFFKYGQEQIILKYPDLAKGKKWDEAPILRRTVFF